MSLPGSGCCCGIIAGIFLSVVAAGAIALAVFLWQKPEAKESGIAKIEKKWDDFKRGGDEIIDKVKDTKGIPKPEIELEFNLKKD